jgi:hypothetical protein
MSPSGTTGETLLRTGDPRHLSRADRIALHDGIVFVKTRVARVAGTKERPAGGTLFTLPPILYCFPFSKLWLR